MSEYIVNGKIVVGAGEGAHFQTLEECDAWIKGRRKIYPKEPFHVHLRFSPEASFKDVPYSQLVNFWDLVKENLKLTLECAVLPMAGGLTIPPRVYLRDCTDARLLPNEIAELKAPQCLLPQTTVSAAIQSIYHPLVTS